MDCKSTAFDKAKDFALLVVQVYKTLCDERREAVMSRQLLRSGTSIGANLAESNYASSRKDFTNKIYIALKETNESLYWIELLFRANYLSQAEFQGLSAPCEEIKRMLAATTKTLAMK